ncbi:hypothetical protein JOD43_000110 [Pullulanibacillus pueri]|uniref:DUF6199 domain-containing protein n=1 Tax=Pullulanibacillus pueri TaxID=1437324 RepID=A0A8J2ZQT5_9BACL|nr:DUF6199 family natural product biosynthesis protein [Pullulanibacillus pueri]MBM7679951.1 hypothetical protein [Pullulanibacillus pueri]GGH73642.1 hypothetical protein GCM10007096_01070 [Pullulanibacillus pueri]
MLVFFGIFIVLGLLMSLKPLWIWRVTESWLTEHGRPSTLYLYVLQILGVIFILLGIIGEFVYLFM